ncbi:hypothetical protein BGZ60DRAFT_221132 [Tricladium varicosporioides]|nr:hypothetical protein BGZ60DRAFT_221132 [Hymenoscyphus varicosporioides]
MVRDVDMLAQPETSLLSAASHSNSGYMDAYCANIGCRTTSYPLSEGLDLGVFRDHLQQNEPLQALLELNTPGFPVSPETDFDTNDTTSSYLRDSAELGPYGECRPSYTSRLSSAGQYMTFSAQDGSQQSLEYVSLSPQVFEPPNVGFNTDPAVLNVSSSTMNGRPRITDPPQPFCSNTSSLSTASPGPNLITNCDHPDRTLHVAHISNSLQCSYCAKHFDRQHLLSKHLKFHTRPYECSHPDCHSHPRRFATRRDLSRHATRHGSSVVYHCEEASCKFGRQSLGKSLSFVRKDHLLRHMRKAHNREPLGIGSTSVNNFNF